MKYHTHKLNSQNHSHIIGRQDSVTGDIITENNEVVFCSACQSVFLIESWEYMNKKHCNQTETLSLVPFQENVIKARKKNALLFEIPANIKKYLRSLVLTLSFAFSSFYILCLILDEFHNTKIGTKGFQILFIVLSCFELGFLGLLFIRDKHKRKNNNIGIIPLQIFQDRIILFGKSFQWQEVQSIIYKAEYAFNFFSFPKTVTVLRVFVDNHMKEYHLSVKNEYPNNSIFFRKFSTGVSVCRSYFLYRKYKRIIIFRR